MEHQTQWQRIASAFRNQRLAQSTLFVGPLHCNLANFSLRVIQLILCKNTACLKCADCQMASRMEHPDMEWVKPEKEGGAIKIEQIRELQNSAFLTPQRSSYKIIVLEAADRMNNASANALLKILEEPAKHTLFILIAQQLGSMLPTLLSRCQIYSFSKVENFYKDNLLNLGKHYLPGSERASIINDAELILDGLIAVLEQREHPCALAQRWQQYELSTMLWFLYLVYSQLQFMFHTGSIQSGPALSQLQYLVKRLNPVLVFNQIDKINTLSRKISHNINVNSILVLEDLLFSSLPNV